MLKKILVLILGFLFLSPSLILPSILKIEDKYLLLGNNVDIICNIVDSGIGMSYTEDDIVHYGKMKFRISYIDNTVSKWTKLTDFKTEETVTFLSITPNKPFVIEGLFADVLLNWQIEGIKTKEVFFIDKASPSGNINVKVINIK